MVEMYLKLTVYLQNRIEELKSEEGQDLIEYAVLVGLISIVSIISITAAGSSVSNLFAYVASNIPTS